MRNLPITSYSNTLYKQEKQRSGLQPGPFATLGDVTTG